MRIYDLPGGVIMTPPLDASMAFYPLDLQGLIPKKGEICPPKFRGMR